jgi:hypothetical protein
LGLCHFTLIPQSQSFWTCYGIIEPALNIWQEFSPISMVFTTVNTTEFRACSHAPFAWITLMMSNSRDSHLYSCLAKFCFQVGGWNCFLLWVRVISSWNSEPNFYPVETRSDAYCCQTVQLYVLIKYIAANSGVPRGVGGVLPPPWNSELLTKLSRIPNSVENTSVTTQWEYGFHLFANWAKPLSRGLLPPDPRSLCPLSSTEFVKTPPPKTIPEYATGSKQACIERRVLTPVHILTHQLHTATLFGMADDFLPSYMLCLSVLTLWYV